MVIAMVMPRERRRLGIEIVMKWDEMKGFSKLALAFTRYTIYHGLGWLMGSFWLHSVCFLGISIKFWVLYHILGCGNRIGE
jgi:hypothetical protein